jgi:hypothetical protein
VSTPAPAVTVESDLRGIKEFLMGGIGCGKTTAIKSFVGTGITPYVIFTEDGRETLGDVPCPTGDKPGLHWRYIQPSSGSFAELIDSAEKINMLSFESLSKLPDINKRKHGQYVDFLKACDAFVCDRCGKKMPPAEKWGTDSALCVDSLSGLSDMALRLMVGTKPVRSQADWGVAMDNLEQLVKQLCTALSCHVVLTAHVEREVDEVTGGSRLYPGTLGRKLAPKLPRNFSDVILAKNEAGKFTWSVQEMGAELKARNYPLAANLPPSFVPAIDAWKKKGGKILPSAL